MDERKLPKTTNEAPPFLLAIREEINSLKERLRLCEDALKEAYELYKKDRSNGS